MSNDEITCLSKMMRKLTHSAIKGVHNLCVPSLHGIIQHVKDSGKAHTHKHDFYPMIRVRSTNPKLHQMIHMDYNEPTATTTDSMDGVQTGNSFPLHFNSFANHGGQLSCSFCYLPTLLYFTLLATLMYQPSTCTYLLVYLIATHYFPKVQLPTYRTQLFTGSVETF